MIAPLEFAGLVGLVLVAVFWFDSMKARESGVAAVRRACAEEGLQLLDETIALKSLKLARNRRGLIALERVYLFEFSDTGDNRRRGSVHLLGQDVFLLNMGLRLVRSDPPQR